MIDKNKVKRHFSKNAPTYDQYAVPENRIGEEMVDYLRGLNVSFPKILDVGCGTGAITTRLAAAFGNSSLYGSDIAYGMVSLAEEKRKNRHLGRISFSVADGEYLPYRQGLFDLLASNMVYQWLDNFNLAFREAYRLLKPGGKLVFTVLGKESFRELRTSFIQACREADVNWESFFQKFPGEEKIRKSLADAGFKDILVTVKSEKEIYRGTRELFYSLKKIGAQNSFHNSQSMLGKPKLIKRMLFFYEEKYRESGGIPVTFERIFVSASKEKGDGQ